MQQANHPHPQSPTAMIRALIIIHFALGLGLILMMIVALASISERLFFDYSLEETFHFVPFFIAVGGVVASYFLFKTKKDSIKPEAPLPQKLTDYQTASILRWVLIEGPGLFAVVFLFLTGNLLYAVLAAALILYFFSIRPSRHSIAETLNLGMQERAELQTKT